MAEGEPTGDTQEHETVVGQPVVGAPEALPPPSPSYTPPSAAGVGAGGTSPLEADRAGAAHDDAGRPELAVAGAFIGAFAFAKLLKRLGGGDE